MQYDKEEDDDELDDMMADIDIGDDESAGGSDTPRSNGSNNHNIHIPQGQGRERGREYGAAPEDQFNHHSQANPHYQPASPAQNQGAPYPQGNSEGFQYPPEPNPNPGIFGLNHSQPHFQESISGHPPGNSGPNQSPRPGQAHPELGEAQRALMDAQNAVREAREEARRVPEEARGLAEEIRTSFSGLGEGMRSPMSQEELDELREEREAAESEGGHVLGWPNPDVD